MSFEYLAMRCCMCPNLQENTTICPGLPGTPHPNADICRFVKTYTDERGWEYKVMVGISKDGYRIKYRKPDIKRPYNSWKSVIGLPCFPTFDAAQSYLNSLAKARNWLEYDG